MFTYKEPTKIYEVSKCYKNLGMPDITFKGLYLLRKIILYSLVGTFCSKCFSIILGYTVY